MTDCDLCHHSDDKHAYFRTIGKVQGSIRCKEPGCRCEKRPEFEV